jgi:hypothetical protein
MNVLDIFFKKYAYKFPKGYPDMNNEQDILLLETILNELDIQISFNEVKKPFEFLSDEAKKVSQIIIDKLGISIDDIKALAKNKIVILSDERQKMFSELEKLGFKRDQSISGSSQGGFKTPSNINIIVKPKSSQGAQSAGKQNESSFLDLINNKVKENDGPITVILQSDKKKIKFNNIEEAKDSSVEGATQFAKADAQLIDSEGKIVGNISLKKRNAVRWESSKTREIDGVNVFKSFIKKVSNNEFPNVILKPIENTRNKFKLFNPQTNKVLSKVIIKNTPSEVINDVIFGNDNPKTIVVKEDFENYSDYTFENGVLVINCYKIYTDVKDVIGTDDEPVYAFSNHIGQAYGIEFRSFSKGLLYKDDSLKGSSEEIDFKDLK